MHPLFRPSSESLGHPAIRWLSITVACLAAWVWIGCDSESGAPSDPELQPPSAASIEVTPRRPNVVLLTVDTLRADHLGVYGYERDTGAALERHFENATTYRRAYSTSSWTAPALASLMTSQHPFQHGVRRGIAPRFLWGEQGVILQQPLEERLDTLAERLQRAGYQTFGVSTSAHASPDLGFDQGFDEFVFLRAERPAPRDGVVYADAGEVLVLIHDWRAKREAERPAFLWVHLLDPHLPYRVREPWADRYRPGDVQRRMKNLIHFQGLGLGDAPVATRRAMLTSLYDGEIHFAFEQLAEILDVWGIDDETLLILTADHGESFYEHDKLGHAESLYEPELRIPLRVRYPSSITVAGDSNQPVSLIDVMPTVLTLADAETPAGLEGVSLLGRDAGEVSSDRILLAELARKGQSLHAAISGRWKLIEDRLAGTLELYDVTRDPHELDDRAGTQPEVQERLATSLRAQQDAISEASGVAIPEEARSFLKALGYVDLPETETKDEADEDHPSK